MYLKKVFLLGLLQCCTLVAMAQVKVLHYDETTGFDHNTRSVSMDFFIDMGSTLGFTVTQDSDGSLFTEASLADYDLVIFSNTSGNSGLTASQRAAFEWYIDTHGGSLIGIHAASDTYRHSTANGGSTGAWDWFAETLGGSVQSSPNHTSQNHVDTIYSVQAHPVTSNITFPWIKQEEYYYWENGYLAPDISTIIEVGETGGNSYDERRPVGWYRTEPNGARVFYTSLGHKQSNFTGTFPNFEQLLTDAVLWALAGGNTVINYQASTDDFANPERGFYRYSSTSSDNYQPLSAATMAGYRSLHQPISDPNFQIYSTLVFRYFVLTDFKTSLISQQFLDNVQADFDAARTAGVKLIPRFAYTTDTSADGCAGDICPPYGDASKSWVLAHINQLGPILTANSDVIAAVQMGFIGIWGEQYYTDFFGDASQPPSYKLLDPNWNDRNEVLQALLDAVPENRMVQVRYPQLKQRLLGGVTAPTTYAALTEASAYNGTEIARIGHHNDCFLASDTDFGTYNDYGNSSTSSQSDTLNLKPYKASGTRYLVVGGETCFGNDPYDNCASSDPAARADTELRRFHYSYLNSQYNHPDVNADWLSVCMEDIKKELGYRFVLESSVLPNAVQAGEPLAITISLRNDGYAACYNPRDVYLLLRNTVTDVVWKVAIDSDPRFWLDEVGINATFCIPDNMPAGTYDYLLHLPDPEPALSERPEYAIRLASLLPDNSSVWEASTGYNYLGHSLSVTAGTPAVCNGNSFTTNSILPVELDYFKVAVLGCQAQLQWTAAVEDNFNHYLIQKSVDGSVFADVGLVSGKGNGYEYTFTDKLNDRYTYYRLKMVDWDGSSTYSQLRLANSDCVVSERAWRVYPNPVSGAGQELTIQFADNSPVAEFELYNMYGRRVLVQSVIPLDGVSTTSLSTSGLPPGGYWLRWRGHGVQKIVVTE